MKRFVLSVLCMIPLTSCAIIFDAARAVRDNNVTLIELPNNQPESTTYKLGDYYVQNGLKGVVVVVDESGKHGLLMSIEASKDCWLKNEALFNETNAFYKDDGMKNMKVIEKAIQETGSSWEDFPLFAWARSLGEGWYIPAEKEAIMIWKNINGGESSVRDSFLSKNAFSIFDQKQRSYGGAHLCNTDFNMVKVSSGPYNWITSTEADAGRATMCVGLASDLKGSFSNEIISSVVMKNAPKIGLSQFNSRAVHKF